MKMKGITCCGDCVYYNIKKHKCIRCENVEPEDAREHFYADCPLPDAEPVRHGKWITKDVGFLQKSLICSACGGWEHDLAYKHEGMNYCPHCGAKMED